MNPWQSIGVELDTGYCKMAASRLLNDNSSLFGHAQFQIELKPLTAVEAVFDSDFRGRIVTILGDPDTELVER